MLNASPILFRSCCLISRSFGQSTRTCITVSLAPHSHLSSPWKPQILAGIASHECLVLSYASRYALFLCRGPYSFCVCFAGRSSTLRRCFPFFVGCYSFFYSSSILSLFCLFFCAEKCWNYSYVVLASCSNKAMQPS